MLTGFAVVPSQSQATSSLSGGHCTCHRTCLYLLCPMCFVIFVLIRRMNYIKALESCKSECPTLVSLRSPGLGCQSSSTKATSVTFGLSPSQCASRLSKNKAGPRHHVSVQLHIEAHPVTRLIAILLSRTSVHTKRMPVHWLRVTTCSAPLALSTCRDHCCPV